MASTNHLIRGDENNIATNALDGKRMLRGATRRPALGQIKGKNDENIKDAIVNGSKQGLVEAVTKKLIANVRPALGDVGNRRETVAANKAETYKNVKARVDCWKKTEAPVAAVSKQIVTRSKSTTDQGLKPIGLARPQVVPAQRNVVGRQSVRVKLSELPKPSIPVRVIHEKPLIKSRTPQKQATIEMTETFMKSHSAKMLSQVEDIDEKDGNNPQLVSEYANDIYNYLYKLEREFPIRENFLDGHAEVTPKMRSILIDWINEVHLQFKLEIECFHLAVSIIDRFLQISPAISRTKLQLVGVTALFFATKYEELFPPALSDFTYICDDCYKPEEILDMEKKLFRSLKFNLSKPLAIHFLRRFSKAAKGDDRHHIFAKYVTELATIDYKLCHRHPSEVAAASLYLALKVFPMKRAEHESTWTPTLAYYSRYTNQDLIPIVKRLAQLVKEAPTAKLSAVFSKYSSSKYDAIAKNEALKGGIIQEIADF